MRSNIPSCPFNWFKTESIECLFWFRREWRSETDIEQGKKMHALGEKSQKCKRVEKETSENCHKISKIKDNHLFMHEYKC